MKLLEPNEYAQITVGVIAIPGIVFVRTEIQQSNQFVDSDITAEYLESCVA